jgi:formate-dependent nitrite reductase cytochrome c552 subunit
MKQLAAWAALSAVLTALAASLWIRGRTAPPPARTFQAEYEAWRGAENRGHAFSLRDREASPPDPDPRWTRALAGLPRLRPLPAGCLDCHSSSAPPNSGEYYAARLRIKDPVTCRRCHPAQAQAAKSPSPRDLCRDCHRQYHFAPGETRVSFPEGNDAAKIEAFYDRIGFSDWLHAETGAPLLKAHHPQWEMNSQGPHAAAGVSCADCHMPYIRRGAARIADHNARSPLKTGLACLACHRQSAPEMLAHAKTIQDHTAALTSRALDALIALIDDTRRARNRQVPARGLAAALAFERKAQWRIDFVASDHSKGFHAPQETARLLAEAIDYARQGQLSLIPARGAEERQ